MTAATGPRHLGVALACLAALPIALLHAAERPFVLDRDGATLTALAGPGLAVAATLPLGGRPEALLRTPDGATVLVLDRGPGRDKGEAGYQATGRSSVAIVDAASARERARIELGFGLMGGDAPTGLLTPDGQRLVVVCPGFETKAPAQRLPRELVTVDVARGQALGRLALEHPVTDLSIDREGRTAVLFSARRAGKDGPLAARVTFVDLAGPSVLGTVELKGEPQPPVWSADGRFLYLLDRGQPHKKSAQRVAGSLQAVSLADRKVAATLDGGGAPRELGVDPKSGLAYFVSDGASPPGLDPDFCELRVIKGAALATIVRLAATASFVRLSAARDRLYVVGAQAIDIVELPSLRSHPLHLDRSMGAIFRDDPGPARELALSPDGKRAFVLYAQSSQLLVLDLAKEDSVALVATGRGVTKLVKSLVAGTRTAMAVRPDGAFAYVLDSLSGDVTIVKAADGTVEGRLAGGGEALRLLPGGGLLAVQADDRVRLIDTRTHQKGAEVSVRRLRALWPTPDETGVLLLADGEVVLLDAASGAETGRAGGFLKATAVVFAAAAGP